MRFKSILIILLCFAFAFLSACNDGGHYEEDSNTTPVTKSELTVRGVWLTCYELSAMLKSGKKSDFIKSVNKMLDDCDEKQLNTVFIQVRPYADSIYPSDVFPLSKYVLSSSGKKPDFDVLETFILLAHERSYTVHAWINPYRISYDSDFTKLPSNSIAKKEAVKEAVVQISSGIFFDPSSQISRKLILDGAREILDNYEVDGIHIDDYFYPTTDVNFDAESYKSYRDIGGTLDLKKWRTENVNALVASLYSLVHLYDGKVFSISPGGDINKNINEYYADVKLWVRSEGFADIIIPQLYFGFKNEKLPFEKAAEEWGSLKRNDSVQLLCGLALYKQGNEDKFAGSGSREWITDKDIIERQKESIRTKGFSGYVLFSYNNF